MHDYEFLMHAGWILLGLALSLILDNIVATIIGLFLMATGTAHLAFHHHLIHHQKEKHRIRRS